MTLIFVCRYKTHTNTHTHTHTNAYRGRGRKEVRHYLGTVIKFTNPNLKPKKSLKVEEKNKYVPRKYFELSLLSKT